MNTCNQSQKQRKPRQTKPVQESTYSFECFDSAYDDQTDEYTPAHTLFSFNHIRGDKSLTCQFIKIVKKICTKTSDGKYRCDPFYIMHKFEKQSAELKSFAQSVYDRIQKEAEETKAKSEYCFENRIPLSQYNEFTRIFDGLTSSEAKKVYMRMVLLHHPDKGGEQTKFVQLQASYDRFVNFQKYLKMQNENRATETATETAAETIPLCLTYTETVYLDCVCVEVVYETVYEVVYETVYETVYIEAVYEVDCESTADCTYECDSIQSDLVKTSNSTMNSPTVHANDSRKLQRQRMQPRTISEAIQLSQNKRKTANLSVLIQDENAEQIYNLINAFTTKKSKPAKKQVVQKSPLNRSLLWKQYKHLGLKNLTYKSKTVDIKAEIDAFVKQYQQSDDSVLLSDAFQKMFDELQLTDFPVVWFYVDEHGEKHKFRANTIEVLEAQYDSIVNQKSDFQDVYIQPYAFSITKLKEAYVPRQKVKRSRRGKGNNFEMCNVIDNELIYCPPSEKCLIDCLSYGKQITPEQQSAIDQLMKKKNVYRYDIPMCLISDVAEILCVKYNVYRIDRQELRYQYEDGQIILCLVNHHYIILKDQKRLSECYQYAIENICWRPKRIDECQKDVQQNKSKYHATENGQYDDTWIQDFEAYPDNVTGQFIPYASGFTCLKQQYATSIGRSLIKNPKNLVLYTMGPDCAYEMLLMIDSKYKPETKVVEVNGKQMKVQKKRKIYIYAHNSANFDTYFYLNIAGIKCINIIEKGGIMSLSLDHTEFKNCSFVIKDTCKFLSASLAGLCKSFKIPDEYCKSSMDHDQVTAHNWLSLKSVWQPYLCLDVVALSLIWIKFIDQMRKVSPFIDVKKYVSIAQLSYSVCTKDQTLSAVKDPVLRQFVQKSIRGGRVIARVQKYETENLPAILNLCGVESIDKLVNQKLPQKVLEMIGEDYQIAFDATSLYPSAMALPHARYLDIDNFEYFTAEQCSEFTVEKYHNKKYIIECDMYAPTDLQFVPISIKTKFGAQFAVGTLRNIVVNDVDVEECLRFGYKIISVHSGIYSNPVDLQFIRDFVQTYFEARIKVKNVDAVLGDIYKLILNSAYGKFGQKTCETDVLFTTQNEVENHSRMYDEKVLECMLLKSGQVCMKVKKPIDEKTTLSPNHIASYILSYSKQIMNNFVLLLNAHKENLIYYMDTDSFYIHNRHYSKLAHVKDCLGGGKNDYGESKFIIKGDYLGCKSKVCYVLDAKTMMLTKKVTWKGIAKMKMNQITQQTIERVNLGNDYMNDITNWCKNKLTGISIQHGCSKKLSIDDYKQKYELQDGVYKYRVLE